MTDEIRQLVNQLTKSLEKGRRAKLTPASVDIALSALRAYADQTISAKANRPEVMHIVLMDAQGWPSEVLAAIKDPTIARAAFREAQKQYPDRRLELRLGARKLAVEAE